MIANPKGGAGKSTLATNVAGCLAAAGLTDRRMVRRHLRAGGDGDFDPPVRIVLVGRDGIAGVVEQVDEDLLQRRRVFDSRQVSRIASFG